MGSILPCLSAPTLPRVHLPTLAEQLTDLADHCTHRSLEVSTSGDLAGIGFVASY